MQIEPSGFSIIYLPCSDNIRKMNFDKQPKANNDQIDIAKNIVKSIRIKDFDSRNFENPSLQKHYVGLQALALEREVEEEVIDYLIPDEEGMKRYEDLYEHFVSEIFPENYKPEEAVVKKPKAKGTKRKREDNDEEGKVVKKRKVNDNPVDWNTVTEDELKKLSVEQLKDYYRSNEIKGFSKLKKIELIEGIINHKSQKE